MSWLCHLWSRAPCTTPEYTHYVSLWHDYSHYSTFFTIHIMSDWPYILCQIIPLIMWRLKALCKDFSAESDHTSYVRLFFIITIWHNLHNSNTLKTWSGFFLQKTNLMSSMSRLYALCQNYIHVTIIYIMSLQCNVFITVQCACMWVQCECVSST